MIEPTPGRVVWFHPLASANPHGRPHAALVAFVQDPRKVNLAVFDENGAPYSATSVPLLQDDDARPEGVAYAEWMPFQKGQATKTEDVTGPLTTRIDALAEDYRKLSAWVMQKPLPTPTVTLDGADPVTVEVSTHGFTPTQAALSAHEGPLPQTGPTQS
jgi:hypothetical protein